MKVLAAILICGMVFSMVEGKIRGHSWSGYNVICKYEAQTAYFEAICGTRRKREIDETDALGFLKRTLEGMEKRRDWRSYMEEECCHEGSGCTVEEVAELDC
ncbi:uncharacterized protein [Amphiura filiformis]|uniref:uncharacterized protein n=1 Tax=Amphiura filiformis TaxID=82378 RepID=UPI003B223EE6